MSKTAYIFPGQGSQYVKMGEDLYNTYLSARAVFEEADKILGFSLSKLCFEGPEEELTLTKNAQPALLVMSIATLAAAREAIPGVLPEPVYVAGHSLGEYTALAVAGALDFSTAVVLARERGRLMYEAGLEKPGAMAAIIGISREIATIICEETGAFIANLNSPGQVVISGATEHVNIASALAKERGAKYAIPLHVSGAFHSPLMESAAVGLESYITKSKFSDPDIPVIGNIAAQTINTAAAVRNELLEQVCNCVQWEATVRYLLSQGVDTFIEIGPGDVLAGMIPRISNDATTINIGDCGAIEALRVKH